MSVRVRLNILAIALVVTGCVWAFQGYGELGGSFMTGRPEWLWIGIACALVGAGLLVVVNSRDRRR